MYDFDIVVERDSTSNIKYDLREKFFQRKDVLPMWVADMDFETPEFIRKAIKERVEHPIYGYSYRDDGYTNSIVNWVKNRHDWKIETEWIVYSPGIVPALNFSTLAFTETNDSIIVQPPVYFPFFWGNLYTECLAGEQVPVLQQLLSSTFLAMLLGYA